MGTLGGIGGAVALGQRDSRGTPIWRTAPAGDAMRTICRAPMGLRTTTGVLRAVADDSSVAITVVALVTGPREGREQTRTTAVTRLTSVTHVGLPIPTRATVERGLGTSLGIGATMLATSRRTT